MNRNSIKSLTGLIIREFEVNAFLTRSRSMLIAPAGHGKTTTIVECLKAVEGHQLILTHTHAGVAAIREKIRRESIPSRRFSVETISGFAQKYVHSFDTSGDIPSQDNPDRYFPYIIRQAKNYLQIDRIVDVLTNTYDGLFVDEYQDCDIWQHYLIQDIAAFLPTRLFGDPMQGIFAFRGNESVDMLDKKMMGEFLEEPFQLTIPHRWRNNGNAKLGDALVRVRTLLENGESIDLSEFDSSIDFVRIDDYANYGELYRNDAAFRREIDALNDDRSLLIVHPEPRLRTGPREEFIACFHNQVDLVEAIDDRDFYSFASLFDQINESNVDQRVEYFLSKTLLGLNDWQVANDTEFELYKEIENQAGLLTGQMSYARISRVLQMYRDLPRVLCPRSELFDAICRVLESAEIDGVSVHSAMVRHRNQVRRTGRNTKGRCIGTTLLTKGLEFDTVVLICANKFDCPKNLYVAMTRASKRLVVFSSTNLLCPY